MFLQLRWRSSLTVFAVGLISIWILQFNFTGQVIPGRRRMGNRPSVQIRQGKIVGVEVEIGYPQRLEQFLGIPYALPTAGEGRFRPPVPIHASTKDFDAGHYGERCPSGVYDGIVQGEACLNLNIYRPKERDLNKKIPVLVYIHGGSFNFGAGQSRQISNLVAWAAEPFIGISFNYRVGAFGFLSSKLAGKEGILNLGLRDQALLLQWVQDNVEAFGGDVNNVTIMGSSAGAHSVGHHLFHNTDRTPLFNRVIMESGGATARACYSHHHPLHEKQFREFLTVLGAEDIPEDKLMGHLRTLKMEFIKRASETIFQKYNPSVRWPFQPVIDGEGGMIPIRPIDAWKSGNYHKVPILTGFNTDEGAMFVPSTASKSSDFTTFFSTLLPQLSEADISALSELYPDPLTDPTPHTPYKETRRGYGAQYARLAAAYGQFAYIAPVKQTAHYASLANDSAPVYLYHFAAKSSVKGGADHGTHGPWVTFNKDIRERSATVKEIAGTMHAYWTSFILTGDPNAVPGRWPERRRWDRYVRGEGEGRLLVFGEGNDEVAGGGHKGEVVLVEDDNFARAESEWWGERTEMFEV